MPDFEARFGSDGNFRMTISKDKPVDISATSDNETFEVGFDGNGEKRFEAQLNEQNADFDPNLGEYTEVPIDYNDYSPLHNKPKVNGVELVGNKTSEDLKIVLRDTTKNWNAQASLIAEKNVLYIYIDYQIKDNGDGTFTYTPGIKVGDGTSYLIDMPFVGADNPIIEEHIRDNTIHVTAEEREFWNKKWRGYTNPAVTETLFFTTN